MIKEDSKGLDGSLYLKSAKFNNNEYNSLKNMLIHFLHSYYYVFYL